ncbi:hypothetical protein M407DRAFT_114694 [Tulasnella calospora MUT 4182]|uniref:PARP catalytic domain-containing protein n=1 Tax=Tulasnella calospora MUT 4182 TaxID=1051891 RepID=A0A0C3Q2W4_9AGAM|nr:hypothetical protein M407DRAFT_114694 [Tulasnella calospora MUT 4182]
MCIVCKIQPAHGRYEFCSKACARAAPKSPASRFAQPRTTQSSAGFLRVQNTGIGDDYYGIVDDYYGNDDGNRDGDDDDDFGGGFRQRRRAASDLVVARRPQLCLNCGVFPKISHYDFCSRTCKSQAQAKLSGQPSQLQPLSNQFTGSGFILPTFTGATTGPSSSSGLTMPLANLYGVPPPPYAAASGPPTGPPCSIPGCTRRGPTTTEKYCSLTCSKAAVTQGLATACLLCKELPKVGHFHWCGPACRQKAEAGAPMLLELPSSDPKFADIVNQFTVTWSPLKAPIPTIHKIYKCINTKTAEDSFQQYRQKVETARQFQVAGSGKTAGNENRRWHGTIRKCTIGDSSTQLSPCFSPACFVCCIIKTGFNIKYAAQGWYGTGLYCSSHSSTSNGYTKGPAPGSPYRAMFLNRVIVGKEHVWGKTNGKDAAARALVAPPDGCDSVASDPKHNEIIVYRNDAMVASWLILYS